MFAVLLVTVSAAMATDEVCHAASGCREPQSLLQVDGEGLSFCPKFFRPADVQYVSKGPKQAAEVFTKYCVEENYPIESCKQEAADVFEKGLSADVCSELLVLKGSADQRLKIFCPEFFRDYDAPYASLGTKSAVKVFITYCIEAGFPAEACKSEASAVFKSGLSSETCRKITDLMDKVKNAQTTLTDMPSLAEVSDVDVTPIVTDKANLAEISGLLAARQAATQVESSMDDTASGKCEQKCSCTKTHYWFCPVLTDCVKDPNGGDRCVDRNYPCSYLHMRCVYR